MGGQVSHPTYQQVCTKTTGHAEVVAVDYDPQQRSTFDLLIEFFSIHDPRIDRRDKGGQYRSAIFYTDDDQHQAAQRLINCLTQKGHHISTELSPATDFWLADERHTQEHNVVMHDEIKRRQDLLDEAMKSLTKRESEILKDRRLSEPPKTLETLGEMHNISRERVRQIEVKAFDKLQKAIKRITFHTRESV